MAKKDLLVGLDIGTTKITAIVAEVNENGKLEVVGLGVSQSKGLKKGMVVDIEATVTSIKKAVEEAELMAGCQINSVYVGVAGTHIKGKVNRGVVTIKGHEVEESDIARVLDTAKVLPIPPEEQVLHVLTQGFILDGQNGIANPLGISGDRLEVEVYIVIIPTTSVRNIVKCVNKAGLDVVDMILQPLASSEAVLTKEEKELGVVMVDVGGGVMDITMYADSGMQHTSIISIGGNHLTNDIAVGLRTPFYEAEKVKLEHSCIATTFSGDNTRIEIATVGGKTSRYISRETLMNIIEPRVEEMMYMVLDEIKKTENKCLLTSGIVLTGGAGLMDGVLEVAEKILDMPVRIGVPECEGKIGNMIQNPRYSTAFGLLGYAHKEKKELKSKKVSRINSMLESAGGWFRDYF